MRQLEKEEMIRVDGGANPILVTSVVTALITFLVGAFYGYSNPKNCNN